MGRRRWLLAALVVALLPVQFEVASRIEEYREQRRISQPPIPLEGLNLTELTGVALGAVFAGFRSQAADIIWWRVNQYFESPMRPRCLPLMKIAVALDPFFAEYWIMLGWHQAYNLAAEEEIAGMAAEHAPEYWVRRGLADLRQGLKFNPHEHLLYRETGHTALDRAGDMHQGAEFYFKAWLTWFRRRGWTEEGAIIYPRMAAHALERMPDFYAALDMYDMTVRTQGQDNISPGAITTILEYYIPVIHAWEEGDIDRALELNRQQLLGEPGDMLGLHLRATLLEEKGDLDGALAAWEAAGMDWRDRYAHRKIAQIYKKTGRDAVARKYLGPFEDQLPINRLVRELIPVGGIGLALDFAYDAEMPLGSTITALLGTDEMGNPVSGTVRFYVNGVEVARRDKPPYAFKLTRDIVGDVEQHLNGRCLVKAETWVEGESMPRWDMRTLQISGTIEEPDD